MPPRTRTQSSGATSARSTRSAATRRSAGSTDSSADLSASTRASSVSASNSHQSSPTPTAENSMLPAAPTTTPEDYGQGKDSTAEESGAGSRLTLDALYAPTAHQINLVHAAEMAQYLQAPETQQSLDALLAVVKKRSSDGTQTGGDGDDYDYHAALSELDYLEGLFKKLRFSYKEQLTKETVVRRILELELPLLSAADIDRMVQDTEAARRRLRASKSGGAAQGLNAEQRLRSLAAERRYLAMAEGEAAHLPDRLLRLRHRLARMKLALRAELQAIDQEDEATASSSSPSSFPCATCGRTFYSDAFRQLHQAMHAASSKSRRLQGEDGMDVDARNDLQAEDDLGYTLPPPMQRCRGCDQLVPAALLENAPPGESHKAFHTRVQRETKQARESLAEQQQTTLSLSSDGLELREDTEAAARALHRDLAELEAREKSVRAEAERQAAIEGETTQSLQHLRDSVGSIRLEMARIEQEADRMVQYIEEGRTYLGRTLQEQTDLFDVLLLGQEDDEMEE